LIKIEAKNLSSPADGVSTKMQQNNVFTVAKRNLEGQDMIYQVSMLKNLFFFFVTDASDKEAKMLSPACTI
jgi:hypothetical protein